VAVEAFPRNFVNTCKDGLGAKKYLSYLTTPVEKHLIHSGDLGFRHIAVSFAKDVIKYAMTGFVFFPLFAFPLHLDWQTESNSR
jgi:hypothetical protein